MTTPRYSSLLRLGLVLACLTGAGCASSLAVPDLLPDAATDRLRRIEGDVALAFTPLPAGEQVQIAVGAMDYSLNRVFEVMLGEMLAAKFGAVTPEAERRVQVRLSYLNTQYESMDGSLERVDMAVQVALAGGGRAAVEQEFAFSEAADVRGYGVRSDQIHRLLVRFTLAINGLVDQQYAGAP